MEPSRIQIKLDSADDQPVQLNSMSLKALESFLNVTTALKNIVESISPEVTFSIEKGSASASAWGGPTTMSQIYGKIEEAVDGESDDEVITANLREIQKEIQSESLGYQMLFSGRNFENKIRTARKIQKKRSKNIYTTNVTVLTGLFNQIGGNDPNYHFDYGGNQRTTIECTINDAIELRSFLYDNIWCLVQKKYATNQTDKILYTHIDVITQSQVAPVKKFIEDLESTDDVFKRLNIIYEFVDASKDRVSDLKLLLKASEYLFPDVNEQKTLLILTKSFRNDKIIGPLRENLLLHFERQMKKKSDV